MAISKINTPEIFDLGATNTSLKLPSGDTASRPTSPSTGQWRYNTDLKYVEYYDGSNWQQIGIEEECTTDTVNFPSGATLAAYYKLDYSPRDESTNNYDGTQVNVSYKNGSPYSQAAVFNGSSSYIDIDNITGIGGTSSSVSISAWFNFDGTSGDRFIISLRDGCFAEIGFNSGYSPRRLEFKINDGANKTVLVDESSITNNTWHHIVLTAESNGLLTAYLDNVSQGTTSIGNIISNTQHNAIGAYNISGTPAGYFTGDIDQVRIYATALTSTQVSELYNEVQCPCTTNTIGYPIDSIGSTTNTSTEAYYKLDGNPFDATANAYNGTWDGTESYSDAPYGVSAVFNGSSSKIDTGFAQNTSNAFSWSLWFTADTSTGINMLIDTTSNSGVYPGCGIGHASNTLAGFIAGTTSNLTYSGNSISLNQWHHTVLTYDGSGSFKLYLDSVEVGSGTHSSNLNSGQNILIGNSVVSTWPGHNGDIDHVRIFSSALTSDQVSELYNEVYCNTISTLDVFGDSTGVALYQFNNSAASTDSSTNNGTWYGTETYVGGYFGSAASFDANSSYVRTPLDFDSAALNNYTISLWIKVAASPASNTLFAGTIDSAAKNGIYLSIESSDTIRFFERNSSTTVTSLTSTDTINIGEWNHIVAVRQYGTNFLYINNGTPVSTANTANSAFSHALDFTIGRSGDYSTSELNGEIDQVRILRKGVSAFEVTQLFSE